MLYSIKRIYKKSVPESQVEKPGFFDAKKIEKVSVHFIAKKKIFKRAVDRNRVKRIARHAFRDALKVSAPLSNNLQQIIFFLERDMMQESYNIIVDSFKKDLIRN